MSLISRASISRASTSLSRGEEVDVGDLADQVGRAAVVGGRLEEVAAGPGPQVLGLADVDHPAGGVLHQVDAGRVRKLADLGRRPAEAEVVAQQRLVRRGCGDGQRWVWRWVEARRTFVGVNW